MNTAQTYNYFSKSSAQSLALGAKLASLINPPMFIELVGDLGGGKTLLVKGIARGLGITQTVTSPTFNIHRSYKAAHGKVLEHFDLYRLDEDEVVLNELADALSNDLSVVCVEWADNFHQHLSEDRLVVECQFVAENERTYIFKGTGTKSNQIIQELQS